MSTNAPLLEPAVNSSTVPTDITLPHVVSTAAKRKYDELVAIFPTTDTSNKKARPKRFPKERAFQDFCEAAFDERFSVAPELLDVVKMIFLEVKTKEDNWNNLVKMTETAPLVFPTLTSVPVVNATNESDESNEFLAQLVNDTVELKNDELPSFLWADGSYDPGNYDQGLLRSAFLLRVFRHIWTGPSSALCGLDEGIPPVCNARLANNKFTATPRMIGCAVVQVRAM
ncbi:hypothetical protein K438DRAFT_1930109, partial [Mycena galopus ATCC 62051]